MQVLRRSSKLTRNLWTKQQRYASYLSTKSFDTNEDFSMLGIQPILSNTHVPIDNEDSKPKGLMSYKSLLLTPTFLTAGLMSMSFLPQLAPSTYIVECNVILLAALAGMDIAMYTYQSYQTASYSFTMNPAFFATVPQYIRYLFMSTGKSSSLKYL